MIAGLERLIHLPTAILAALVTLMAVALVLFPGTALAQEGEVTAPTTLIAQIVVSPGDSLWSISQERLGPGATQERVALEVQRIHDLNRNQIGDDPSLILPGQRLSLPPLAEEPAAKPAAETLAPRPSTPPERDAATAAQEAPERMARPAPSSVAKLAAPPALPEAEAVLRVRSLPTPGGPERPYEDYAERRRMLGFGVLALTLVLAAFIAWKLPMRRAVGDAEAWGVGSDYHYYHRSYRNLPERDRDAGSSPGSRVRSDGAPGRPSVPTKPALVVAGATRRRKKKRASVAGSPHKKLAVVHDPVLRRALRRSSAKKARDGGPLLHRARGRLHVFAREPRGRA